MNFHDILITSPSTFIKKVWEQDRRICYLILGVNYKGLKIVNARNSPGGQRSSQYINNKE